MGGMSYVRAMLVLNEIAREFHFARLKDPHARRIAEMAEERAEEGHP